MLHSPSVYSCTMLCYSVKCVYVLIFTLLNIEQYLFSNYFLNLKITNFNGLTFVIVP